MGMLSSELRDWLVPGLAGTLASVDVRQQPQIARIWMARPTSGDVIEVYLLRSASLAVVNAVVSSGRAALNLIQVATYRSRTFKGRCEVSPVGVDDAIVEQSLIALNRAFHEVGMRPDTAQRLLGHCAAPRDMVALTLSVESVFDQSPKPGAGARL
jgi:hypothetical protein